MLEKVIEMVNSGLFMLMISILGITFAIYYGVLVFRTKRSIRKEDETNKELKQHLRWAINSGVTLEELRNLISSRHVKAVFNPVTHAKKTDKNSMGKRLNLKDIIKRVLSQNPTRVLSAKEITNLALSTGLWDKEDSRTKVLGRRIGSVLYVYEKSNSPWLGVNRRKRHMPRYYWKAE